MTYMFTNPGIIASGAGTAGGGGGPIAYASKTSGNQDTASSSSASTASITPTANALVVAAFGLRRSDSVSIETPTSVTGNGGTWVAAASGGPLLIDDTGSSRIGLIVYRTMISSPSAGAVTITMPTAAYAFAWSIVEFTGVDTGGTNGSGAVLQAVKGTPGIATSASVTLSSGSAGHATYGAFAHRAAEGSTAGSGFTEAHDQNTTTDVVSLMTEYLLGSVDTSVDASWSTSTDGGGIALEIKVAP